MLFCVILKLLIGVKWFVCICCCVLWMIVDYGG